MAFGARACSIAVFDPESAELVFEAATGAAGASVVGMRLSVKRGIAGYVVASGQAIAVHDVERDPRFDRETAEATGYLPRSILAVPIETTDEVSGVIEVLDWSDERVGEEGLELAGKFARQAGLALQQAELFSNMGRMVLLAAGQASKSEDPDLARSLRTASPSASTAPPPSSPTSPRASGSLAELGSVERRAALALLEEFAAYAAPSSAQTMRPAWAAAFDRGRLGDAHPLRTEGAITRQWAFGDGLGAGVKVAIVDSGIEDGHPMVGKVAGAVAVELDPDDFDGDGLKFVEGPHEDLYGHGTACAGIIHTIAPEAELYSVRVLGAELTGRASVFAAGLRWAIEHDMDIVNLSLSTSRGEWYGTFHELVDLAYFRRCVVVSAMNNLRMPTFPSEFASVVSVAAHSGTNPERFDYNPDGPAEFGAPGIDVEVAWSGGGTLEVTGNSFAAPHIAGMVARIMGQHPDATPFQVKTILHALADNARR